MKQRILTGVILLILLFVIFYVKIYYQNDNPIYFVGAFLIITAMTEMISMKETEKPLPFEIRLLSYLSVLYLGFYDTVSLIFPALKTDFDAGDVLPFIFIVLLLSMVLRKRFKIVDAGFIFFAIYYIGLSFHSMVFFVSDKLANPLLNISHNYYNLIYIILIAILTDTGAYFIGSYFGKHKLAPSISPKKTIEGSVGGSLVATLVVSVICYYWLMPEKSLVFISVMTFLLTVMSQFGDLIASTMKRHYKIKDFGALFPGHGGVLDRFDSIIFTSLTYYYFIEIYLKIIIR